MVNVFLQRKHTPGRPATAEKRSRGCAGRLGGLTDRAPGRSRKSPRARPRSTHALHTLAHSAATHLGPREQTGSNAAQGFRAPHGHVSFGTNLKSLKTQPLPTHDTTHHILPTNANPTQHPDRFANDLLFP